MGKVDGKLTVYFEEPFWVGIFERVEDGKLSVVKVTFGAEPREYEVYDFVLKHYNSLKFSPAVEAARRESKKNPKRMQREANKLLKNTGIGTRSQQALKLQHDEQKNARKVKSREQKLEEAQRRFEQKQQKKKEKHKGH